MKFIATILTFLLAFVVREATCEIDDDEDADGPFKVSN